MASKLSTWLGTRTAEQLAEILTRRPDAIAPPTPRTLSELAERLQSRASVTAAFRVLPQPGLQVIEVLQALGRPSVGRDLLAAALGRTPDDPDLTATLDVLALRALVWPDGDSLHMADPLWSAFPHPLHLGPPAEHLYGARTADEVHRFATALGLPPGRNKQQTVDELARWMSDGGRVRAAVGAAPAGIRALLNQIAWDGPTVTAPGVGYGAGHHLDPALRWALDRGLLVVDGWQTATMPAEVGTALRGPDWRAPFTPRPPQASLTEVTPSAVAGESAAAAGAAVLAATALLEVCAKTPVTLLKLGGVGVRELRRLGKVVGGEGTARLWLELAANAGLLGGAHDVVLPTEAYDDWCAAEPAQRLVPLLRAWLSLPAVPLAVQGPDGDQPAAALTYHVFGERLAELRRELLCAAAELPDGYGVPDGAALAGPAAWRSPLLLDGLEEPAPLVAATWREAALLGVVAHGALTPLGRALLADAAVLSAPADGDSGLAATAARLLPAAVPSALFQADLTAVVPGTPAATLAALLDSAADRESRGGAVSWRFSAGSVRRALDAGASGPGLLDELRAAATSGSLPQPLEYLVGDVARRHGQVRVRTVACVVRADDPALLAEIAAVRSLAPLRLSLLAPTVLASGKPAKDTLAALRAAGYAPVAESAAGDVVVERVEHRRAPSRPRRGRPPAASAGAGAGRQAATDPVKLAEILLATAGSPAKAKRAGRGAAAGGSPGRRAATTAARGAADATDAGAGTAARPGSRGRAHLHVVPDHPVPELVAAAAPQLNRAEQRLLADALEHTAPVKIFYTNAQGSSSVRVIEPLSVHGHLLEAWCHLRDEERMFALDRIDAVGPV